MQEIADLGVKLIISNRPEGESIDQPNDKDLEIKAKLLAGEFAIPVQRSLDGGNLPLFDKEVRKYRIDKRLS